MRCVSYSFLTEGTPKHAFCAVENHSLPGCSTENTEGQRAEQLWGREPRGRDEKAVSPGFWTVHAQKDTKQTRLTLYSQIAASAHPRGDRAWGVTPDKVTTVRTKSTLFRGIQRNYTLYDIVPCPKFTLKKLKREKKLTKTEHKSSQKITPGWPRCSN